MVASVESGKPVATISFLWIWVEVLVVDTRSWIYLRSLLIELSMGREE
jgi:hypothetical protein